MVAAWRAGKKGSLNELDFGVDGLLGLLLALVVQYLLLLEEVPAVGIDGDDQGAKLLAGTLGIGAHAALALGAQADGIDAVFQELFHLGGVGVFIVGAGGPHQCLPGKQGGGLYGGSYAHADQQGRAGVQVRHSLVVCRKIQGHHIGIADAAPGRRTQSLESHAGIQRPVSGRMVASLCAAMYNWAKRELFSDSDPERPFEKINGAVLSSPAGANGCLALPYFQGRGTPDWNSAAKGAFVNLSLGTTRADMVRAVLEAIALEAKNNIDVLERYAGTFREIYIGGGLTHFDVFNQIQADVYGKTLLKETGSAEATAFGAWLGAAVALGLMPDYETAFAARERTYQRYTPNPENKALYTLRQQQLNDAYRRLFGK